MRRYVPALVLGFVVALPVVVAGAEPQGVVYKPCERKATPEERKVVKQLHELATNSYNEGDYAKAIQYWRDAFERDCAAVALLTNLANAYEKSGNLEAAIYSLETYLNRLPAAADEQNKQTIQKRVENMKKARAAASAAAVSASASTSSAPAPAATPSAAPTGGETPRDDGGRAVGGGGGVVPLVVTGVGGALLVVGGLTFLGGRTKVSDAEKICPVRSDCTDAGAREKGNSGRTQITVGGVVAGVGVLGVAGGLAWYFMSKPDPTAAAEVRRFVVPDLAPGYAGARAGLTF